MKNIFCFILLFFSVSCFAFKICDKAPDTSDDKFCDEFASIAKCHCENYYLQNPENKKQCGNMDFIYSMMIATFNSQSNACHWQVFYGLPLQGTYQECMKKWDYYRSYC